MKNFQKTLGLLLGSFASLCVFSQYDVKASDAIIYNSQGDFVAGISAGTVFTNTFSDISGGGHDLHYTNQAATISYDVTAPPGGLFFISPGTIPNPAVASYNYDNPLRVDFTSSGVNAVGGLFFLSDIYGGVTGGTVTVGLSDGTSATFSAGGFHGFIVPGVLNGGVDITYLTISSSVAGEFPSLDNLMVAIEVPEPSTLALAGLGAGALLLFRRKK